MAPTVSIGPATRVSLHELLDASSSKSQTPTIDLDWEPFQSTVESFLRAIDGYVHTARTEIANFSKGHADTVKDLKMSKEEMERRIQVERERERDMLSQLENERQTITDLNTSLSQLQRSLAKVREQSASVEAELSSVKKDLKNKQDAQERQRATLEEMRQRDERELKELQDALGLQIDGVRDGTLLLRFTLLDPADPDREFSLLLDVSGENYLVPNCSPSLSALPEIVRQLNTDRNLFDFIRKVRKAFKATIPERTQLPNQFDGLPGPGLRTPGHRRAPSSTQTQETAA